MSEQKVSIEVDAQVTLEGGLSLPEGPARGQAIILHPHPLYGGSMHNNVVEALAQGALAAGWGALRFNFRGVGGSSGAHDAGRGEQEDVAAAAAWLGKRHPGPLALMGYSFGTLVGSAAAARLPGLAAGVWVAPPLAMGELAPWPPDAGPLLLIAGDDDEFGRVEALAAYAQGLGARGRMLSLEGVDHFFWGLESVLAGEAKSWLKKV
jgi:alpha/beta superfamily hydrolase